jgi:hypothetical protein
MPYPVATLNQIEGFETNSMDQGRAAEVKGAIEFSFSCYPVESLF